jgi:hypothetical protein
LLCACTMPRKHVYIFILFSPREHYNSQLLLKFFYCNMRKRCLGNLSTYMFYCPHANLTEMTVSYSSTAMCLYVDAETCLPIRFIVPRRTVQRLTSPTILLL